MANELNELAAARDNLRDARKRLRDAEVAFLHSKGWLRHPTLENHWVGKVMGVKMVRDQSKAVLMAEERTHEVR